MGSEGHKNGELIHSRDNKDIDVIVYVTFNTELNCCRTAIRTGLRSHQSNKYYSALLVLNIQGDSKRWAQFRKSVFQNDN
jgi:hypothetical protein